MQTIKLYLAYFLLLCTLVLGGFGLASYFESKRLSLELVQLEEQHGNLARANEESQNTIAELKRLREDDQKVLMDFNRSLATHDLTNREVRVKIATLEKNNAEIAQLLDTILPADGCVLDNSCGSR